MSSGMRVWGADGSLQMDTDSFTYQVLHNALYNLSITTVITVSIPGFNPANCVAVILPTQAAANSYCNSALPYQTVALNTVTIRAKNPAETDWFSTLIQFRLLVMRYKN